MLVLKGSRVPKKKKGRYRKSQREERVFRNGGDTVARKRSAWLAPSPAPSVRHRGWIREAAGSGMPKPSTAPAPRRALCCTTMGPGWCTAAAGPVGSRGRGIRRNVSGWARAQARAAQGRVTKAGHRRIGTARAKAGGHREGPGRHSKAQHRRTGTDCAKAGGHHEGPGCHTEAQHRRTGTGRGKAGEYHHEQPGGSSWKEVVPWGEGPRRRGETGIPVRVQAKNQNGYGQGTEADSRQSLSCSPVGMMFRWWKSGGPAWTRTCRQQPWHRCAGAMFLW